MNADVKSKILKKQFCANEGDIIGNVITLNSLVRQNDIFKVFLGFDEELGINVYVKEIRKDLYKNENIKYNINLLTSIESKNIPKVYKIIEQNDTCYLVIQYINGIALDDLLKIKKKTERESIEIVLQLCEILKHLSNLKVLHSSIGTKNMIVDNSNHLYITDYSVSEKYLNEYLDSNLNIENQHAQEREDIRNLGQILYSILLGKDKIVTKESLVATLINKEIKEKIVKIISRTIIDDNLTYKSIAEFKNDLYEYYNSLDIKDKRTIIEIREENDNQKEDIQVKNKKTNRINGYIIKTIIFIIVCSLFIFIMYNYNFESKNIPLISSVKENKLNKDTGEYLENSKDNADSLKNSTSDGKNYNGNKNTGFNGNTNTNGKVQATYINPNAVSGSILGGAINITVTDYVIDDNIVMINLNVQNNYDHQIEISNHKMHIRDDDRDMLLVDDDLMAKNQPSPKVVDINTSKDFTIYFSGYKPSENLTLCIEEVTCEDSKETYNHSLELKFK